MQCLCEKGFKCSVCQEKAKQTKWGLIEMTKNNGLILVEKFDSKEQAEEEMANQISIWTHWNIPGCPCQKKFAIFEIGE